MIELRNVRFAYEGTTVLDGVSLTVEDDEFVLLAGPNGSGKTTLLRQCNGLLSPDAGTVRVNGRSVADHPVAARAAVGMVFQEPRDGFVAATVAADVAFGPENLGLDRKEIDERVESALTAVGMDGRGEERIDRLSGGERARVAIAGALAMAPDHLALDEPLTGLDQPARQSVLDRLQQLHEEGRSVVYVTPDLGQVLDLADRVIVLGDGTIVLDEPTGSDQLRDRLQAHDLRC